MRLVSRVFQESTHNEVINEPVSWWVGEVYDEDRRKGYQVVFSAMRRSRRDAIEAANAYIARKAKAT